MTAAPGDASHHHPQLPMPALAAFATPGLPIGALAVAITVYLPRYYATHFGLGLAAVGAAFMIVRLVDMLFDPMIGLLMDRSRTSLGRYRLWLAGGAPILMLAVFMVFTPPGAVTYAYLLIWLFIYYVGASIITLAHVSWASVIASKYHERSRVFGVIQVISIIGASVLLLVPSITRSHDFASDVRSMGWFIFGVTPVGVVLAILATPEKQVQDAHGEKFGLRDYLEMIFRPDMRRIIVADFCLALGPGWMAALYLYYFHDARGFTSDQSRFLLLIYIAAGVIGAGVLSWVATRYGKHRTLMGAAAGYSIGLISLTLLPQAAFLPAAFFMFLLGFLAAGFPLLDRAMVADVGDAVHLEQGKHRVGVLFAMITSSQKIAAALSIGLTFTVLAAIGYNPKEGAVNSPATIHGLELTYLIGPIFFVMVGAACFIGYKLDHTRHSEIRAQLDARDALAAAALATPGAAGSEALPLGGPEPEPG